MNKDRLGNKSHKYSQIKVDWQHTKELTPAFKRLMALLLEPKIEPKAKEEGKQ